MPTLKAGSGGGKLDTVLGKSGPIARHFPGFIPRPQQIALARGIETALVEGRPALAEAGTGVGKTLAYLVPLVRWLVRHGGRAVVSTHTLALQGQLTERDIPNLLAALPEAEITASVLKGRSNFLCLSELETAASELWTISDPNFKKIQRWSNETDSGDFAELDFAFPAWQDVAANSDTCKGRECRHYERCFYFRARKNAEACQLLVVNHALFFADLRLRRATPGAPSLLPSYDAAVFDEAHHIEEMATKAFGLEFGSRRISQLVARARRIEGMEQDRLALLEALNLQLFDPFLTAPKAEAFLDEALTVQAVHDNFYSVRDELYTALNLVARDLTKCADADTDEKLRDKAQGLARTTSRMATELALVTRPDEPVSMGSVAPVDYFRWYSVRRLRTGAFVNLVKTPLDVAPLVRETLLGNTPRTVLVSATLAAGGSFSYLKKRLGLDETVLPAPEPTEEPAAEANAPETEGSEAADDTGDEAINDAPNDIPPPVEIIEGSPFDYQKNCLLYVPRRLGGYNPDASYTEDVAGEVLRLVNAAQGRTFALFTSHRMLSAVRDLLWDNCDYPLFTQGDMPNARLVDEFIKSGNGVLLGTASFWEGVDVPGQALSCVIIDKLPFAPPDTPTQRARETAIKAEGGDSFRQVSLPQAQVRLKQGFGRLLRTATDSGVVAILDNRLWTKNYGREMLNDLPPCPRTDDFADVAAFFAREEIVPALPRGRTPTPSKV